MTAADALVSSDPAPPPPAEVIAGPPDAWITRSAADGLAEAERRAHNTAFERREVERWGEFFERVLPQPLNHEQRAAIVVDEDATLVVASAGSGKTTLLLGKIAYLVARGLARPEQIALLAFNNSVRAEIRERLAGTHPDVAVHTFHSLGLELIRMARGGACRLSAMATDAAALQGFITQTLSALADTAPAALADWLAAHAQPQRDAADFPSARDWALWARRHPPLTLRGERVRSHALREVADRLALAGITYRTGAALRLVPGAPLYIPDLLLPDAGLVIDVSDDGEADVIHRGGARKPRGSGPSGPARRLGRALLAALACRRHGLRRHRVSDARALQWAGRLGEALARVLADSGLDPAPRAMLAVLAGKVGAARLDATASLLGTALSLQRGGASRTSPDAGHADPVAGGAGPAPLAQRMSAVQPTIAERDALRQRAFDALHGHVAAAYAGQLSAHGEIDFGDMIAQAVLALDEGVARVPFRYLLVDEFQDISAGRAALVSALRRSSPGMRLLAVGDDWQSIYRFAGSDVSIMTGFSGHFGHTETRFLRRTFRFDRRLEAVASAFVLRNPGQIRKQVEAREPDDSAPAVLLWLPPDADTDDPMPGIAAHLCASLKAGSQRPEILILGRYRSLEAQARLDWLATHHPQADWRFSTIHRAKGATADHAVLLGVRGGRQPFPAERPEDPVLSPFLGTVEAFPHAEERRLFYVALTRARHRVYVVGDRRQPSGFFEELLQRGDCVVAGWDNLAP